MTDLFERDTQKLNAAIDALARQVRERTLTRKSLHEIMRELHGGGSAEGLWSQRDAFDLMEAGLVRYLLDAAKPGSLGDITQYAALTESLPTQTVRSEEQIALQQFSTPADLAALVVLLARPKADDIMLEPSAGHGILAAFLPKIAHLHLNELDPRRREKLGMLYPRASLTGIDGALLTSLLPSALSPSLILMNPPFARSEGRGADRFAAARHLRSAIAKARGGARIVAIMPDWFTSSASMEKVYTESLAHCTVRTSLRLASCYSKQGTSVAVRLYVIDKLPGTIKPTVIARDTVAQICEAVVIPERTEAATTESIGASAPMPRKPTLFRAMRTAPRPRREIPRALPKSEPVPISYDTLASPRPLGDQAGVYIPYRPSRIDIAGASEHPTALVESVAMASIPAPIPSHLPVLLPRVLDRALLSEAQLETVIYAGHAWSQYLHESFVPDREGVGLSLDENGHSYRQGYFLGDGTGAGKGRQIAACILDNWLAGRRKAIWISLNESLIEDARRDWCALGGLSADIQPLSNWKIDEPVPFGEGIVFVTYPTLRSQRQDATRLYQLLNWAGADFEGVIAFDESHEMGGVAGGESKLGKKGGSLQGIAGVMLQNHLPGARVLYASATGASDVNNLAYAVRLGLWGPQTSFSTREDFIAQIRAGGIAAMELVSRDLKALGLYQARALSFAGVEYEVLRHELTPEQIAVYDSYSESWSVINRNMETALALTNVVDDVGGDTLNSGAKAAARSRFEGTRQRFFNQVLLSMKLPSLIAAIDMHLADDQSIVVQLVSTAESVLDRRLDGLSAQERAAPEIDLSPVEVIVDYLDRAFPTQQMRTYVDDTGTARSMPLYDDDGNPVHNQEAIRCRDAMIEHLCALPPIRPALDGLIEHYGPDRIAEVTGRTKRLVPQTGGVQRIENRSARTNLAEADQFMNGAKRILIFSQAGGTGRSYHASLDVQNQQQRVHFLLEPGWRADRAIQGLGRTHRTHQASTPLFRPVTTDCKGELRFTSTIARRLDALGALTRGQRQTGGQNLFDPADNLESEYAKAALVSWYTLLSQGKLKSTSLADFEHRSGLQLTGEGGVLVDELPPIQRWLNRILALPIAMQNSIFDEFLGLVEARVEAAREAGTLDAGVETIQVEDAQMIEDHVLRTDPRTGATTHLLTMEISQKVKPVSLARIEELEEWTSAPRTLINAKSKRVALCEKARSLMQESGDMIKRVILHRPTRRDYMLLTELEESAWESCDRATFERRWREECAEAAERVSTETVHIATGLLLPIWSALPKDYMTVNRIVDADGNSWLGRIIHESDVPALLNKFGVSADYRPSVAAIMSAVAGGRTIEIEQPFPMTIRRSLVAGEQRTEICGAPAAQLPWLKSLGCFTEIIAYRTRVFVPGGRAGTLFTRLLAGI